MMEEGCNFISIIIDEGTDGCNLVAILGGFKETHVEGDEMTSAPAACSSEQGSRWWDEAHE